MPRDDHPNVLLICTDHWPGPLMGSAGHLAVMTPTLKQLAGEGTCFANAYSACPSCIPARRSLMTGLSARSHGDRNFNETLPMPDPRKYPTVAQCFRDAGYQAYAVGKLHVYPQRSRIGFDDVILFEEGRRQFGLGSDEWEQALADAGHAGLEYAGGACHNDYNVVPWHLPAHLHPINWTAREMCRTIHRRDPTRPAFWYLSFAAPHPPLMPLPDYLDLYRDVAIDAPVMGSWARDRDAMPWMLRSYADGGQAMTFARPHEVALARRAFYATLTHIDHQIRVVVGMLREAGLLDDTVIAFTSDHGDMLGDHGKWAKTFMFEMSAKVPLLILPRAGDERLHAGGVDDRLVELRDVMPTLLDLAGLPAPAHVEGMSLARNERRDHLYGEHWEGPRATRMVRDDRYKLIYYPVGNRFQLFDLADDPRECNDLAGSAAHEPVQSRLTEQLLKHLYGEDLAWVRDGQFVGLPDRATIAPDNRDLAGQRGIRFM